MFVRFLTNFAASPYLQIQEAMDAQMASLAAKETEMMESRLHLLASRALAALEDVSGLAQRTHDRLGEWIRARYRAECSAVSALDKVVKEAAIKGTPLPFDLRLKDTKTVVDETTRLLPPLPELPPARPRERPPPASLLSTAQLSKLISTLVKLAPGGFVKPAELVEILLRGTADGLLPDAWKGTTTLQLMACLRQYDPTFSGYVDWRELVTSLVSAAFPIVMAASCADMADQVCGHVLRRTVA